MPLPKVLQKMIDEERLSHALLFTGPDSAITNQSALEFAKELLGINKEIHPDLHLYHPEEKSGLHTILSVRSLIEEVTLFPYSANWKIFIIYDVDKMLPTSSNALLKTLEEPTSHTIIILTTTAKDQLLSTIRSRTQEIFFPASLTSKETETQKELLTLLCSKNRGDYLFLKMGIDKLIQYDVGSALFGTVLEWARDLVAIISGSDKLIHSEFRPQMEKYLESHPVLDLFGLEKRVREARLSYERGVKFSHCLEELLLCG